MDIGEKNLDSSYRSLDSDHMKIRKGMHIEDQGKTWIIRSIVNNLVMISEKGKPKALRRYIKLQHLEAIPAW